MIDSKKSFPVFLSADIPDNARVWRNNEKIRKWCRQYSLINIYKHHEWIVEQSEDPQVKMFGISIHTGKTKPKDSTIVPFIDIGVCGLTSIDLINRNAEFSLYVIPEHQRVGYGKKALDLLLRHGFQDMGLERIWGETFDGNPAGKMFESMGMKKEGTQRKSYYRNGSFIDSHIYAVLKDEYLKKRSIKIV